MDIIQHIFKNPENNKIINKYLGTWFIVREWMDTDMVIKQINQEIENIETAISTIKWSKSNLLKIKNMLFYMKQNILWKNMNNLTWYDQRFLATERLRYQKTINDICKKYPRLSIISENIVIKEDCNLKIINQSIKDLNLLPETSLQKIKNNWIWLFIWDKNCTDRWFNHYPRWVNTH